MKLRLFAAAFAAAIGIAAPAAAQDWVMLTPDSAAQLPAEARTLYDEAAEQIDRVNYDEAVKLLAEAAAKAPAHADIQFLTLLRARNKAEAYYSQNIYLPPPANMDYSSPAWRVAEPFFDIAEAALQRLQANPDLTPEQLSRVQRERRVLEQDRAQITDRDAARTKTGLPFLLQMREQRLELRRRTNPEIGGQSESDTRLAEQQRRLSQQEERQPLLNPFAMLPGEAIAPFMPPAPVAPAAGAPAGPAADPFAGGAPPTEAGSGPEGAPAAGNPFDEGAPADAAPADAAPADQPADAAPAEPAQEDPFG